MCDRIVVTLLKMQPRYGQSSRENATPSSDASPLASYKEVPPPPPRDKGQDHMLRLPATYIGETGRNLSMRPTEHKRATRNDDVNNHIATHHLQTKHQIDWDSAT